MAAWIAVAIGGALGSVARHGLNYVVHSRWLDTRFPVGTVAVNIVGCFLIGLLTGMIAGRRIALPLHWREFVFVGVLGGFTTFSTFGLDTYTLARSHSSEAAAMNVAANMIGGLAAVWIGYAAGVRA
jgi:fluoride exporter